jgi:hypothetical protein
MWVVWRLVETPGYPISKYMHVFNLLTLLGEAYFTRYLAALPRPAIRFENRNMLWKI